MPRSLVWKLALAFWLVSLIGIVLVAVLAGRLVGQQSAELERQINREAITERLADFYIENNGWPRRPPPPDRRPQRGSVTWAVINEDDRIVLTSHRDFPPIMG